MNKLIETECSAACSKPKKLAWYKFFLFFFFFQFTNRITKCPLVVEMTPSLPCMEHPVTSILNLCMKIREKSVTWGANLNSRKNLEYKCSWITQKKRLTVAEINCSIVIGESKGKKRSFLVNLRFWKISFLTKICTIFVNTVFRKCINHKLSIKTNNLAKKKYQYI